MLALLCAALLFGSDPPGDVNVNSRYTVESVDISDGGKAKVSRGLREDIENLVGEKLNPQSLDRLARRIRRELHARVVTHKVSRGTQPEHVIVAFEVKGERPRSDFDVSIPKGVYHAKSGWSAGIDSKIAIGSGELAFGILSDGDALLERYAGLHAGFEKTRVFTDRVRLGFDFASYHQKWNPATEVALASAPEVPGVYRTRQDFAPALTVVIAEPLTLSVGASFQRFQTQFPAARTEAANAVTTTLRFSRRLEDSQGNHHEVNAGYGLRAATKVFDTDFVYARHAVDARYEYSWDKQSVALSFLAGRSSGTVPLFDRFILGNISTLRGWNKFDVNPLGGTRAAHGSLEYRFHWFHIFYDTGALWNRGESPETKHSLGVGFRESKGGFFLALAFPVRSGRADPIFMMGTDF